MKNFKKGFTLIELLVVVAIIGILSAVVMAFMSGARSNGGDAAVKADLKNATSQGEIFYSTNTNAANSYTRVCDTSPVGAAKTVEPFITAAAKAEGLTYNATAGSNRNVAGANGSITCNDSAGAWATEVPLKTTVPAANQFWCVDSFGRSKQETGTSLTTATTYTCP